MLGLESEFLKAADRNQLDWRLLPSIAFIESGCGKVYINNNILGWDSCKRRFRTIADGIHEVGDRLAQSDYYKGKSIEQKLWTYNPVEGYPQKVQAVMAEIGSSTNRSQDH